MPMPSEAENIMQKAQYLQYALATAASDIEGEINWDGDEHLGTGKLFF